MTCGECVHCILVSTHGENFCRATAHSYPVDILDGAECPAFRTPAQARLEKAAPEMLAALKEWCSECEPGP